MQRLVEAQPEIALRAHPKILERQSEYFFQGTVLYANIRYSETMIQSVTSYSDFAAVATHRPDHNS